MFQIVFHYFQIHSQYYLQDLIMIIVRIRLFMTMSQSLFLHCSFVPGHTFFVCLFQNCDSLLFHPMVKEFMILLRFYYQTLVLQLKMSALINLYIYLPCLQNLILQELELSSSISDLIYSPQILFPRIPSSPFPYHLCSEKCN